MVTIFSKRLFILVLFFCSVHLCKAQSFATLTIIDAKDKTTIEKASIAVNKKGIGTTDKKGEIKIPITTVVQQITITCVGYKEKDTSMLLTENQILQIALQPHQQEVEAVTVVASTRNNQRIENAPLKVEVLGSEEMTEESAIKPAGIGSILGDISGVQIQQSSAVSGNSNVRIQGIDGRYTQILKDGLPLYDGFSGGFGILSIPPLDLKQVELIKGSASTLYGGGAIGGLVNIISQKPSTTQQAIVSINQTTLRETNFNTFFSKKYKHLGYTFFGGSNLQKAVDVNKDGFSDVPSLKGFVIHPRIFFYPTPKTTITLGYTGTFEKRNGGDMQVINNGVSTLHQFFENNTVNRNSFELLAAQHLANNKKLEFKNSGSFFNRTINTNATNFTGKQVNYYSELSLIVPYKRNSFVTGINTTGDAFKKITNTISLNNFSNTIIGAFAQHTWNIKNRTIVEAGIRNDYHTTYGNFILPRLSLLHHITKHWATRAGVGFGYKTPNALSPQNTDIAIEKILPLASTIKAEKSIGYNAEINYKTKFGEDGENEIFINHAFFLTQLNKPIIASELISGNVIFNNEAKPIISKGYDTYIKATIHEWELYFGYTYTIAERKYLQQNQFLPLTPKNRFAFTIVRDWEEAGIRFGLEGSYTGAQYRYNYTKTPSYFFAAGMVEKKLGKHFSVVLNGENLFDYRQSKVESLFTGTITTPSFQPLWAPIDGRVFNCSVKYKL